MYYSSVAAEILIAYEYSFFACTLPHGEKLSGE
jgi:hypothetical protein